MTIVNPYNDHYGAIIEFDLVYSKTWLSLLCQEVKGTFKDVWPSANKRKNCGVSQMLQSLTKGVGVVCHMPTIADRGGS